MKKSDKGRDKRQDKDKGGNEGKGRSKGAVKQGVPVARGVSGALGSRVKPDASAIFRVLQAIQADIVLLVARQK